MRKNKFETIAVWLLGSYYYSMKNWLAKHKFFQWIFGATILYALSFIIKQDINLIKEKTYGLVWITIPFCIMFFFLFEQDGERRMKQIIKSVVFGFALIMTFLLFLAFLMLVCEIIDVIFSPRLFGATAIDVPRIPPADLFK